MSSSVLRSWLNSLARAWSRRHCKRTMRSRRPRPTPLEVWQLEERRVPSTLITLASFNNTNGASPSGPLIEDSSGNLFGTTGGVGGNGNGTVYELARGSSTVTVLGSFANGEYPSGGLVEDSSGNLFGTTLYGGVNSYGTVFELAHGSSTITTLAVFYSTNNTNGIHPNGSLVEDSSGNLFGTTNSGGGPGYGTVFELAHGSSTITTLASFNTGAGNGAYPTGGLVEDGSGNLFGTTGQGGAYNVGTVFELAHGSSTITTLASFNNSHNVNGVNPTGSLVEDSSGNLFGTTQNGGAYNYGTVFELAHGSSTITTLAYLTGTNGANPQDGLVEDSSGNLFGTTPGGGANNFGTVFELAQGSSTITTLASFNSTSGANPSGSLVEDSSGNLFGTTQNGGAYNYGTVFELDQGPSITAQPQNATATVGQTASVSLTVAASGGITPLTVQWQISTNNGSSFSNLSNSSSVSGATTTTLILSGFATAGSAEYRAILTDAKGATAPSNAATLTINAAPAITMQPQNAIATVGQSASESFIIADSGGTGPLTVQWQISTNNGVSFSNLSNGSTVTGTTTTTLTLSGFVTAGSGEYRAIVTDVNGVGATSNAATLFINAAPSITTQPASQAVTTGQTASQSFNVVAANGTNPFTFQWQASTDGGNTFRNVSNGAGIGGASMATLTISSSALPASGTEYKVVVTDANGVTVTSTAATLTINAAPSITTQPQNATATVGQSISKSFPIADSGGTGPLTVQWQISTDNGITFTNLSNGSGIAGATTTTLTVSGFTTAGSPEYRAIVMDANGVAATSNAATLTISATPSPANPDQSWLGHIYADFFNRALDASGLATWSNLLGQGVSRMQVVQLLQSSVEYRTDVVETLYAKLLHRPADASGLNAFTSFLGNGGTAEHVEAALLGSPEYFQLHGGTNNSFLSGMYQDVLNRGLDGSGAQSWGLQLAGSSTSDVVARAILASLEAETDEVQSLFNEFLHRATDPSGMNSFTTALQQGVPTEQVISGIVGSDEYFAGAR